MDQMEYLSKYKVFGRIRPDGTEIVRRLANRPQTNLGVYFFTKWFMVFLFSDSDAQIHTLNYNYISCTLL